MLTHPRFRFFANRPITQRRTFGAATDNSNMLSQHKPLCCSRDHILTALVLLRIHPHSEHCVGTRVSMHEPLRNF